MSGYIRSPWLKSSEKHLYRRKIHTSINSQSWVSVINKTWVRDSVGNQCLVSGQLQLQKITRARWALILVPRGCAPFGQHQESRPLAWSNDIPILNGFVNPIDWDQNQSDLSKFSLSMHRVTGSPWIADFRFGPGEKSRFLVLTKWSAASRDENGWALLEPAIWSHDTGQRIPCFDRCQLTIAWMFNIKDIRCKPRLQDLVLTRVRPPCCAISRR